MRNDNEANYSFTTSPTFTVPSDSTCARRPPRCIRPLITDFPLSLCKCSQGSHRRMPRTRTRSNQELPTHQMVQRHASGNDIATRFTRGNLYLRFALHALDRLGFNQRQLIVWHRLVERSLLLGVAVSDQAHSRHRLRLFHAQHRRFRFRRNVDGFHSSLPHNDSPAANE